MITGTWAVHRQRKTMPFSFWRLKAAFGCLGLQQAVFVTFLYIGDHSPKTAVTGTRSH